MGTSVPNLPEGRKTEVMQGLVLLGLTLAVSAAYGGLAQRQATSAPPTIKLTYFDIRGRGEVSRLLMTNGGIPYTEKRVSFAEWPAIKPTMPYGTMPLFEINGRNFTQSIAIQSYLAKLTGMYPSKLVDQLMTDQIMYAREDIFAPWFIATTETDPAKKAQLMDTLVNQTLPLYLGNFEKYIAGNPAQSGFVFGTQATLADIVLMEGTQNIFQEQPALLAKYPKLMQLRAQTAALPGLKDYLAKRPVTAL